MTFSESTTPASGSDSTSSPGPGIARLTPAAADPAGLFLDAEGRERGGIFFDELDLIELSDIRESSKNAQTRDFQAYLVSLFLPPSSGLSKGVVHPLPP